MSLWSRLQRAWQDRQEAAALRRRPIPDKLWRRTLKRFPFLGAGDPGDEERLRRMTSLFLDRKEFAGAHGLSVTDDMAVAIAAQACLPVLERGLSAYDGFVGIVIHPGQARVWRERVDDDGVVHAREETLSGETVLGGPVMLSWRDVRASGATAQEGYNVVIHEFAHVLDLADGLSDGCPKLPADLPRAHWQAVMGRSYDDFCTRVDADRPTELDPYGAEGVDEFFAVCSEAFFTRHDVLQRAYPELCSLLRSYYRPSRRDPKAEEPGAVQPGSSSAQALAG